MRNRPPVRLLLARAVPHARALGGAAEGRGRPARGCPPLPAARRGRASLQKAPPVEYCSASERGWKLGAVFG